MRQKPDGSYRLRGLALGFAVRGSGGVLSRLRSNASVRLRASSDERKSCGSSVIQKRRAAGRAGDGEGTLNGVSGCAAACLLRLDAARAVGNVGRIRRIGRIGRIERSGAVI